MPTELPKNFYLNKEFENLFNIVDKSNKNVFLTGRAGTGKSTFVEYLRIYSKKQIQILAFTGVSAIKGNGRTIHSFFNLPHRIPNKKTDFKLLTNREWINKLELIIIDEISMVRADLLYAVDRMLQKNRNNCQPFGGIQVFLVGDIFQLPPVVTSGELEVLIKNYPDGIYFFNSKSYLNLNPIHYEFKKVFRQKDRNFVEALEEIRLNNVTKDTLDYFNQRVVKNNFDFPTGTILLAPTNRKTFDENSKRLDKIDSEKFQYIGLVTGDFSNNEMSTEMVLDLKVNAQVMMVKNDREGRWVNGTIGKIYELSEDKIKVKIRNKIFDVHKVKWEKWEYKLTKINNNIKGNEDVSDIFEPVIIGSFEQFPIKLAWAATIHKCQGQTFDNAIVDFDCGTFAHGMAYVALSRVKTLSGLFLKREIYYSDIKFDVKVRELVKQTYLL